MKQNYYEVLEIEIGSDLTEIKKAYRRLSLIYHPDKNKSPDATEKFQLISEAYHVLSNEQLRNKYNDDHIEMDSEFDLKMAMNMFRSFHPEFYEKWLDDIPEEWVDQCQERINVFMNEPETKMFGKIIKGLPGSDKINVKDLFSYYIKPKPKNISVDLQVTPSEAERGEIKKVNVHCYTFDYCEQHINVSRNSRFVEDKAFLVPADIPQAIYKREGDCCKECGFSGDVIISVTVTADEGDVDRKVVV